MGPSMSSALAENFSPGWKRAAAGVGFGGALAENEGTNLNKQTLPERHKHKWSGKTPSHGPKFKVRNMDLASKHKNQRKLWLLKRNRLVLLSKYKNIVRLKNPTYEK